MKNLFSLGKLLIFVDMKKIICVITAIVLISLQSKAQEINKQETGYFNLTEVGYFNGKNTLSLAGATNPTVFTNDTYTLSLRNINGVFLSPTFSIGAGLGLDGYTFSKSNSRFTNTFLFFADVRYYLKDQAQTFFIYGDLGASIAIDDNIAKGPMIDAGAGYKLMLTKKSSILGSIGIVKQSITGEQNVSSNKFSSLAFKIGLLL